jgi:hypothetical protein
MEETELKKLQELKEKYDRGHLVEMILDYQNNIENPPITPKEMYAQAASSDGPTLDYWSGTWLSQIAENKKTFGNFKDKSVGKLHNINLNKPCIIAGAGPSLKKNGHLLKNRNGLMLVSCLHNFHYFEDQDIEVDYYVTLDAGPVTIGEVSEGGKHPPEHYWERTKTKKLIAFIGSHPELLKKWQGEIYFYNALVGNLEYQGKVDAIEKFNCNVSTGGNVLGACLYIAKGFFGSFTIAYTGADFCFSYMRKFHAWDSKYDKELGNVLKMTDVFGNKVLSWQSYANFKAFFDHLALSVPGIWVNCTEGGTLGAFPEGNILAIKQMKLSAFLDMCNMSQHLKEQSENPETDNKIILF